MIVPLVLVTETWIFDPKTDSYELPDLVPEAPDEDDELLVDVDDEDDEDD